MADVVVWAEDNRKECVERGRALAGSVGIATAGAVLRALSAAADWVNETTRKVDELARELAEEHGMALDGCEPLWVAMGVLIGLLESGRAIATEDAVVVDGVPVTVHRRLLEFARAFGTDRVGGYVVRPLVVTSHDYPFPGILAEEPGTGLTLVLSDSARTADGERVGGAWSLERIPELMWRAKCLSEVKNIASLARAAAEEAADVLAGEMGIPRNEALKAVENRLGFPRNR